MCLCVRVRVWEMRKRESVCVRAGERERVCTEESESARENGFLGRTLIKQFCSAELS